MKRFPNSNETRELRLSFDMPSSDVVETYFSTRIPTEQLSPNLIYCPDCNASISKRATVCPRCGCPIAEIIVSNPDSVKPAKPAPIPPVHLDTVFAQEASVPKIPRCPTCGSTNVERISLRSKAGKVLLVGVFAIGRVAKSFKCNNCKHQW
ncbi:MAG: hypothetical protein ABSA46_14425 [Thermodesulfovibrionales bacterium]|jgi:Zn finger protein HypA/HybF involved in hydrogenase expression